jgi:hypothetical protein
MVVAFAALADFAGGTILRVAAFTGRLLEGTAERGAVDGPGDDTAAVLPGVGMGIVEPDAGDGGAVSEAFAEVPTRGSVTPAGTPDSRSAICREATNPRATALAATQVNTAADRRM